MSAVAHPEEPGAAKRQAGGQAGFVETVLRARTFGIVGVLGLLVLVTTLIQSRFLDSSNIKLTLGYAAVYGLVAIGESMVIISRNVDLSVGSVMGISAYISANQFQAHQGFPIVLAFVVGLAVGIACGVTTGAIVTIFRVPSLVVSLAMLYIIRGVDFVVVGSGQVVANSLPDSFTNLTRDAFLGIPDIAWVVAGCVAVAAYFLRTFRPGRDLYAIGSDPQAARLAGLPIERRIFMAFVISGAIAGLAGVLWASQYNPVEVKAAENTELTVITAVVVGGVAISGGTGSVIGAALGAVLFEAITTALPVLGIDSIWVQAISGALLLAAITLDRGIQMQLSAALRRRRTHLGA